MSIRKYRQLLESLEKGEEVKEEESLAEDRYEEELPSDEDMGMDSGLDMDDYEPDLDSDSDLDLDSELDMEIARDGLEDDYMGDDEYVAPSLDDESDMGGDLGSEEDDVIFNYTATIQLTGYDFPLVLQADDMEEIKTVMRVMKQSGLNPQGDYKWNSKTFEIDLDESVESDKKAVTEESDDDWAYDEGCEAAKADCKAGLGNYIGDPRETVKDDKEMSSSEKQKYMKGYKKTLDDKGYKLSGTGEKTQIVKK